jgi:hypothetical protein
MANAPVRRSADADGPSTGLGARGGQPLARGAVPGLVGGPNLPCAVGIGCCPIATEATLRIRKVYFARSSANVRAGGGRAVDCGGGGAGGHCPSAYLWPPPAPPLACAGPSQCSRRRYASLRHDGLTDGPTTTFGLAAIDEGIYSQTPVATRATIRQQRAQHMAALATQGPQVWGYPAGYSWPGPDARPARHAGVLAAAVSMDNQARSWLAQRQRLR